MQTFVTISNRHQLTHVIYTCFKQPHNSQEKKKKKKAAKHFTFKAHMLYELLLLFKLYIASFFFILSARLVKCNGN